MAEEKFHLVSSYAPTGDQPQAIAQLVEGVERGDRCQTLLGVTGSGKTFTMANVIAQCNRPTYFAKMGCKIEYGFTNVFGSRVRYFVLNQSARWRLTFTTIAYKFCSQKKKRLEPFSHGSAISFLPLF